MLINSDGKQQIDPAFPRFIWLLFSVLQMFNFSNKVDISSDQCIQLFDESEGFQSLDFRDLYESANPIELLSVFSIDDQSASSLHSANQVYETFLLKSEEGFNQALSNVTNMMSTASKQYYWEVLERIKAAAKEVPAGQDEITRDMIAFICSLNFHCLMIIIKEFTDRKATLTSMNSRSFNYFIFGFFDLISLLVNRKGLRLLFDEARNGSDDALYQLIR